MLTQVLHEATYCIIIRHTYELLSPNFSLSHEFRSSNATPAKHHVKQNRRSVRVKRFAIRSWAEEAALISFSKNSSSNFSQVRPSWLLKANLFTSAFCCLAHFRHFWILRVPASVDFSLGLSSYLGLSTRNEKCSS